MTDPIGNCILAGVNGAGKSTLYEALNELKGMPRINTDEIVKERVKIRINKGGHGVSEEDINNYKNELQSANLEVNQAYPEISIIRHKGKEDEKVYLNMEFLGLDLSKVPMQNLSDPKVYIIPILYILSTFISTKLTTSMNKKDKDKKLLNDHVEDYEGESKEVKEEVQEVDMMEQTNKSMSLLMPIMSISISLVAPLGLALYWLTSNVLMILERIFMNKYFKSKEEKENVK